jgi:hypothetical protein
MAPEIVRNGPFLKPEIVKMVPILFWSQKSSKWCNLWLQKWTKWSRDPLYWTETSHVLREGCARGWGQRGYQVRRGTDGHVGGPTRPAEPKPEEEEAQEREDGHWYW